jgi:tetratricopeptide (TPR) repeat protein
VIDAYEKALEIRLEDSHVLNNLAWFYATCEIESLRDPKRALQLSRLAVGLEQSSHIYDTLAESYFVNGMFLEAAEAGERALKLSKDNRSYYKKQIEKFRKAAKQ